MSGPPRESLRVVVLGLSLSSSWGNGHATTYRALLKAFVALGHDVLFLERDVPWYAAHRDLPDPGFCRLALYPDLPGLEAHRGAIAEADAVVVGSYVPEGVAVGRLALERPRVALRVAAGGAALVALATAASALLLGPLGGAERIGATLGLTAGASAPELLVRELVDRLSTRFDVTEREERVRALEQARRRFQQAFHSAPTGMALVRLDDSTILDANRSLAEMLDRPVDDLVGRTIREVTHPERGQEILDRLADELSELAVVEQRPQQDGRNMTMMLGPSKAVLAGTLGEDGEELPPADDEAGDAPALNGDGDSGDGDSETQ